MIWQEWGEASRHSGPDKSAPAREESRRAVGKGIRWKESYRRICNFLERLEGTERGNGGGDPKDDERVCGGDDDREQVHLTASAGTWIFPP